MLIVRTGSVSYDSERFVAFVLVVDVESSSLIYTSHFFQLVRYLLIHRNIYNYHLLFDFFFVYDPLKIKNSLKYDYIVFYTKKEKPQF